MYMEIRKWIKIMMTVVGVQICLLVIWGRRIGLELYDDFLCSEEFLSIEGGNLLLLFLIVLLFTVISVIEILILKNLEQVIRFEINNVYERISEIEK